MAPSIFALITARKGSKRVPRKNIRMLAGKPLIQWTIEAARNSHKVDRILMSTDDSEVADIGRTNGIEIPFLRPSELAIDSTTHIDVVTHALEWLQNNEGSMPDYLLTLQPTSPFRRAEDIDAAIGLLEDHPGIKAVVSVCESKHSPLDTLCVSPNGVLEHQFNIDCEQEQIKNGQKSYSRNGAIYINSSSSLLNDRTFLPPGTMAYLMPGKHSIDIDTEFEFHIAELLMRERYDVS